MRGSSAQEVVEAFALAVADPVEAACVKCPVKKRRILTGGNRDNGDLGRGNFPFNRSTPRSRRPEGHDECAMMNDEFKRRVGAV
jgi:hypothetical protein